MLTGMDIDHVRSMASKMLLAATDVRALVTRLTAEIENAPWQGPDRDEFVRSWREIHARSMGRVADDLEGGCSDAREFARRQERASS